MTKKPKGTVYQYNIFNVEVGDMIYDECSGPCSSAGMYDMGERVIEIKKFKSIRTKTTTYLYDQSTKQYRQGNYWVERFTKQIRK